MDLKYHPDFPLEAIGTSVTSTLSPGWVNTYRKALPKNPHVNYFDEFEQLERG